MATETKTQRTVGEPARGTVPPGDPCLIVIFGASGDLTKRLLMPALYNLACDGLLPEQFAIVGIALDELTTEDFRGRMTADIKKFNTRKTFDEANWQKLVSRLHYTPGNFGDPEAYRRLAELVAKLDAEYQADGNIIFYMATPPSVFGLISEHLSDAGFKKREKGWTRIIVEKPFGRDLPSAIELNRSCWPTGRNRRSIGSTTTSARRRSRTCSPSASPTACSSRSGTRTTSTTSSSPSPRRSASRGAATTTTRSASCAT